MPTKRRAQVDMTATPVVAIAAAANAARTTRSFFGRSFKLLQCENSARLDQWAARRAFARPSGGRAPGRAACARALYRKPARARHAKRLSGHPSPGKYAGVNAARHPTRNRRPARDARHECLVFDGTLPRRCFSLPTTRGDECARTSDAVTACPSTTGLADASSSPAWHPFRSIMSSLTAARTTRRHWQKGWSTLAPQGQGREDSKSRPRFPPVEPRRALRRPRGRG